MNFNKRFKLFFGALFLLGKLGFAQSIPIQLMVVDQNGFEMPNKQVKLRLTIREDTSSATGQYQEVHNISTNDLGIVSVGLGEGVVTTNSQVLSINMFTFSSGEPYIKTELDTSVSLTSYDNLGWMRYRYPMVARRAIKADTASYSNQSQDSYFSDTADYARNFDESYDGDTSGTNELQTIEILDGQLTLSKGGGTVSMQSETVLTKARINNRDFVANDSIVFIYNTDTVMSYRIHNNLWDTLLVSDLDYVLPELNLLLSRTSTSFVLKDLNNVTVSSFLFNNYGQISEIAVSDSVISFKTNINGGNAISSWKWVSIDLKDNELSSDNYLQFQERVSPSQIGVVGSNWGSVPFSSKNVDDFSSSVSMNVNQIGYDKAYTGDYYINPYSDYLYQFKSGTYTTSVSSFIQTTFLEYDVNNNTNSSKTNRLHSYGGGVLTTVVNYGEKGLLVSFAPSTKVAYGASPIQFDNYLMIFDWQQRDWRIIVDLGAQYLYGGYRAYLCKEYMILARMVNPMSVKSIANGAEVEILRYKL